MVMTINRHILTLFSSVLVCCSNPNIAHAIIGHDPIMDAKIRSMGPHCDLQVRSDFKLPLKFFACKSAADCDLEQVGCGLISVSKPYKGELQTLISNWKCKDFCGSELSYRAKANCIAGKCSTITSPGETSICPDC